ncbi:MAG: SufE family protein [Marinirhabdus sp.]
MTIAQIQEELITEFALFDDWTEKYEHLISLGKNLPLIDAANKTDDKLIKGCQSKVWLHTQLKGSKVIFTADSDAIITKGIVAILIRVFSGQTPRAIAGASTAFIDKIGLREHLSPTRANGLAAMVKQMKLYAVAYRAQLS